MSSEPYVHYSIFHKKNEAEDNLFLCVCFLLLLFVCFLFLLQGNTSNFSQDERGEISFNTITTMGLVKF